MAGSVSKSLKWLFTQNNTTRVTCNSETDRICRQSFHLTFVSLLLNLPFYPLFLLSFWCPPPPKKKKGWEGRNQKRRISSDSLHTPHSPPPLFFFGSCCIMSVFTYVQVRVLPQLLTCMQSIQNKIRFFYGAITTCDTNRSQQKTRAISNKEYTKKGKQTPLI